jgi:hypothetical protein
MRPRISISITYVMTAVPLVVDAGIIADHFLSFRQKAIRNPQLVKQLLYLPWWSPSHPTFKKLINLHDVSYFVHTYNFRFLISLGNSLEGIHSVQFAFSNIRAWRALQIAMHVNWLISLSAQVRQPLLFSRVEISPV